MRIHEVADGRIYGTELSMKPEPPKQLVESGVLLRVVETSQWFWEVVAPTHLNQSAPDNTQPATTPTILFDLSHPLLTLTTLTHFRIFTGPATLNAQPLLALIAPQPYQPSVNNPLKPPQIPEQPALHPLQLCKTLIHHIPGACLQMTTLDWSVHNHALHAMIMLWLWPGIDFDRAQFAQVRQTDTLQNPGSWTAGVARIVTVIALGCRFHTGDSSGFVCRVCSCILC